MCAPPACDSMQSHHGTDRWLVLVPQDCGDPHHGTHGGWVPGDWPAWLRAAPPWPAPPGPRPLLQRRCPHNAAALARCPPRGAGAGARARAHAHAVGHLGAAGGCLLAPGAPGGGLRGRRRRGGCAYSTCCIACQWAMWQQAAAGQGQPNVLPYAGAATAALPTSPHARQLRRLATPHQPRPCSCAVLAPAGRLHHGGGASAVPGGGTVLPAQRRAQQVGRAQPCGLACTGVQRCAAAMRAARPHWVIPGTADALCLPCSCPRPHRWTGFTDHVSCQMLGGAASAGCLAVAACGRRAPPLHLPACSICCTIT